MIEKKKIRKLEFTKETVARLGDQQLNDLQGGTAGPGQSNNQISPCTLQQKTRASQYTCNVLVCTVTR